MLRKFITNVMTYKFLLICILTLTYIGFCMANTQKTLTQNSTKSSDIVRKSDAEKNTQTSENDNLIPRKILFGNPEKTNVSLSPEGSRIAFLAPYKKTMNIWIAEINNLDHPRRVTNETVRDIQGYTWNASGNYILFVKDNQGDENFHLYSIDLVTNKITDLTPFKNVRARIIKTSMRHPNEILIGLNNRDPQWHDVYRLDLNNGNLILMEKNNQFSSFIADEDLDLRFATKMTEDGGYDIYIKDIDWEFYDNIPFEDSLNTHILGFSEDDSVFYKLDSQKRNTSALVSYNLDTDTETLIAYDPKIEISNILLHPTELTPQAIEFYYAKPEWKVLDKTIQKDFTYLKDNLKTNFAIANRTLADDKWLVVAYCDTKPSRYYLYSRDLQKNLPQKLEFLFTTYQELDNQPLVPMHVVNIKSRDGLNLVSYLTLPADVAMQKNSDTQETARTVDTTTNATVNTQLTEIPTKPLPLVLFVHGGPWARDGWGLNMQAQWLANRGYAVLEVNYRGSSGFGKDFLNAGNKEWAGKMHDDLIDAVNWAIEEKIADPQKIAIVGGSYGGYASLVGLTFTPDTFACGISIVGPSNLITLLESIPPYWKPEQAQFNERVGNISTAEGRQFLASRSPINFVEQIKKPLLILQGKHDPRVKQAESDQIVNKMQEHNIPVTYVLYHNEGHGFVRSENSISSFAIMEQFLAQHLGGRYEKIGKDFLGANFSILAGKRYINGIQSYLQKKVTNLKTTIFK